MTVPRRAPLLTSPFIDDVPRAFSKFVEGQHYYTGPYFNAIYYFAHFKNLHLRVHHKDRFTNAEIITYIQNGYYNISLLGGFFTTNIKSVQYSYPVAESINCIMVPLEDELPKYYYVIWPFGRWIWLGLILGVFYVAYLLQILEQRRSGRKVEAYFRFLLQSMAILLYSPNLNLNLNGVKFRSMFVYVLLFLFGFVLSNFHICYMTTYCMKPIFVRPINTIEELTRAKIPVLVTENVFEQIRSSGVYSGSQLETISVIVNRSEFHRILKSRDRAYAYVMAQDQWDYLNRQQRNLQKPYFHLSKICFNKTFLGFPMRADPKFNEAFNAFIIRVQETGLWRQWEDDAFMMAVEAGFTDVMRDEYPVESLSLEFFWIAWLVLFIGLSVSCVVIILECIFWYRKPHLHCRLNVVQSSSLEDHVYILD